MIEDKNIKECTFENLENSLIENDSLQSVKFLSYLEEEANHFIQLQQQILQKLKSKDLIIPTS